MKNTKDDLKTALNAISYLPNAVAAWADAHGGNKALAKKNAEKLRQAEQLMSEILASMPNAKTYRVVGVEGLDKFDSEEALVAALEKKGIKKTGYETRSGLYPELINAPTFNKLIGPMYDGAGVCRYDTQEVYDYLSR